MGAHHVVAEQHWTVRQLKAAVQRHRDQARRHFMTGAAAFRQFVDPEAPWLPIFNDKEMRHLHAAFEQWYSKRPKCWEQRVLDQREERPKKIMEEYGPQS